MGALRKISACSNTNNFIEQIIFKFKKNNSKNTRNRVFAIKEFSDRSHIRRIFRIIVCLRRVDSGLVFKYEARPKPNPILVSKECAKNRA